MFSLIFFGFNSNFAGEFYFFLSKNSNHMKYKLSVVV